MSDNPRTALVKVMVAAGPLKRATRGDLADTIVAAGWVGPEVLFGFEGVNAVRWKRIERLIAINETLRLERDAARAELDQLRDALETLADDLTKAEPRHFSLGLMRVRVKALRALFENPTDKESL